MVAFFPKEESLINYCIPPPAVWVHLCVYCLGGWSSARLSFHDRSASLCIMKPDQRAEQAGTGTAADVSPTVFLHYFEGPAGCLIHLINE